MDNSPPACDGDGPGGGALPPKADTLENVDSAFKGLRNSPGGPDSPPLPHLGKTNLAASDLPSTFSEVDSVYKARVDRVTPPTPLMEDDQLQDLFRSLNAYDDDSWEDETLANNRGTIAVFREFFRELNEKILELETEVSELSISLTSLTENLEAHQDKLDANIDKLMARLEDVLAGQNRGQF